MSKYSFCVVLFIFIHSCNSPDFQVIDENVVDSIYIDDLSNVKLDINNIRYIPLETTKDGLIGSIGKLIYASHKFYIWDNTSDCINVFSDEGKFIYNIRKKGQGPGEYILLTDMDVSPSGDVYVGDYASQKIIRYNNNGSDSQDIPIGYSFMSFSLSKDSCSIYLADIPSDGKVTTDIARYDIEKREYVPIRNYEYASNSFITTTTLHRFFRSDSKVYVYNRFTPYIYIVDMDSENKYIKLITEHIPNKEQVRNWDEAAPNKPFESNGFIYDISACYETDDTFLLITHSGFYPRYTFIKKDNPQMDYNYEYLSLPNLLIYDGIKGVADTCFVTSFSPTKDKISYIMENNPTISKEDIACLSALKEDDNPVLMLFQFDIKE
jgi:hypothetical protein